MTAAPWFADVAEGEVPQSLWLRARDGVRLRAALWRGGDRGTVFLLPGRTEYVEKYSQAATELAARGYGTLSIDWRGQGLADRALSDAMSGHVDHFDEYQADLDALMALARGMDLPQPWFLMSHSMGGCIALRGLMRGLPVKAAVFSAPMWGIAMAAWMRPAALALGSAAHLLGQRHRYAPSTNAKSYVAVAPFTGNVLTSDLQMFNWMRRQVVAHPELALGGPSLAWLRAALRECAELARLPSPDLPCLTALGTAEKVVDTPPVHLRMSRWPGGRLDLYPGAEHEVMMESPATRARFFDSAAELFARAAGRG
ncbi:MAG: alpha/beta hydrolase [Paracoccaceae bacterium]